MRSPTQNSKSAAHSPLSISKPHPSHTLCSFILSSTTNLPITPLFFSLHRASSSLHQTHPSPSFLLPSPQHLHNNKNPLHPVTKQKKNPSQTPRLTASPRMKPKPPRQSKQTAPIQSTRLQHRLIISTPPLQSHLPSPSIQDNSGADIACSRGVTSDGGRDDRARDIDPMFSAFLKRGGPRSCLFPSVIHSLTCIQSSGYAYVELERRLLRLRSGRRREGLGYLLMFTLGV